MKKRCGIIANVLAVVLLTGCAAASVEQAPSVEQTPSQPVDKPYELIVENGDNYLLLDDSLPEYGSRDDYDYPYHALINYAPAGIFFSTVEEMKSDILSGNFTSRDELSALEGMDINDDLKVRIFNHIYSPVMPEDASIDKVLWQGETYRFIVATPLDDVKFEVISKEEYDKAISRLDNMYDDDEDIIMLDETVEEDRNATVRTFAYREGTTQEGDKLTKKIYTLNEGEKSLLVCESYQTEKDQDTELTGISVRGVENGVYFQVTMSWDPQPLSVEQRPSVEWLSAWGVIDGGAFTVE